MHHNRTERCPGIGELAEFPLIMLIILTEKCISNSDARCLVLGRLGPRVTSTTAEYTRF